MLPIFCILLLFLLLVLLMIFIARPMIALLVLLLLLLLSHCNITLPSSSHGSDHLNQHQACQDLSGSPPTELL